MILEAILFNEHEDIMLEILSSSHLKHYFAPYIDFDKYRNQMHRIWIPVRKNGVKGGPP